jgi:Secretion system C-terminal sorting domain
VKAISGDCTSPLSAAATVVVNPIPPAPTITLEANGGLTSSASDGNQWYFNDVKIDNATQKTINPTKSGNYTVKVTTPCASEVSKPYNLVVTATEETILGQVQLSPNPFTNQFKVSFPVEFGKTAQVKIVDMSGNVHFKKASVSDGEVIELGNLNGGNYILHLNSNDNANLKSIKISKIH